MEKTEPFCSSEIIAMSHAYAKVHGYVSLLVCLIGSLGNVVTIIIFGRKEMISPVNIVLRGLSVADLVALLDYVPYCWIIFIHKFATQQEKYSYQWALLVFLHSYFSQVFHTIGIWLTVALAMWRYIAIAHPLQNRFWCDTSSTRKSVIAGYVICPILCAPIIYSFIIQPTDFLVDGFGSIQSDNESEGNITTLYIVSMRKPDFMVNLNFIIYSVLLRMVPSILLTALSIKIIYALMKSKKNRHHLTLQAIEREKQMDRITQMLLGVLFLFLVNEIPQGIFGLLTMVYGEKFIKQCYVPMGNILDVLALINSSLNFFLYCTMSSQYRASVKQLVCKLWPSRRISAVCEMSYMSHTITVT